MTAVYAATDPQFVDEGLVGRGVRPREILYILGLYEPRADRRQGFEWLDGIRLSIKESDYGAEASRSIRQNPRQNLGNHLKVLLERRILRKRGKRYLLGANYWSDVGPLAYRKLVREKLAVFTSNDLYSPNGVATLLGVDRLKMSGFPDEFKDEVVERFEALARWMRDKYDEDIRARERRGAVRREMHAFFPLILVDPNELIEVEVKPEMARLEKGRRFQIH